MSELRKFVKEKQDQQQKEGSQILNRFSAAI